MTLIDLAFTNKPELIIKAGVEHVGISNHSLIFIHRQTFLPSKKPKTTNIWQFKYYNINGFRNDLSTVLQTQSNETGPNSIWNEWKIKFLLVTDMHAPQIIRKVKNEYVPWITNTIKRRIYHGDYLKKEALKTASKHMYETYKRARNELTNVVRNTKAAYYMNE